MPVQVTDIIPERGEAPEETPQQAPPPAAAEAPQQEVPEEEPPAPKRRGRPPGSKNRPKPSADEVQDIEEVPTAKPKAEPVRMKRATSRRVLAQEESKSEEAQRGV